MAPWLAASSESATHTPATATRTIFSCSPDLICSLRLAATRLRLCFAQAGFLLMRLCKRRVGGPLAKSRQLTQHNHLPPPHGQGEPALALAATPPQLLALVAPALAAIPSQLHDDREPGLAASPWPVAAGTTASLRSQLPPGPSSLLFLHPPLNSARSRAPSHSALASRHNQGCVRANRGRPAGAAGGHQEGTRKGVLGERNILILDKL